MDKILDINKIPKGLLEKVPAGKPPPGVQPNLVNPTNDVGYRILAGITVVMVIMLFFATLRFYVAIRIKRRMGWDDWMAIAAILASCWYYILVCIRK
jgi:hypothetical protein